MKNCRFRLLDRFSDAMPSSNRALAKVPRHRCLSAQWIAAAVCLLPAACQQKMANQPSYKPDDASTFFADGRSSRPLIPGTVARGHLRTDYALYTGRRQRPAGPEHGVLAIPEAAGQNVMGAAAQVVADRDNLDKYTSDFPFPVTVDVLRHGRNRYMIYCAVCHGTLGTGHGKIVERGYTTPPSYHIERLRKVPVGYIFEVITNGYGSMPEYKQQIPPRDRWAIVGYVRALQLSQHFPEKDLPEGLRAEMANKPQTPGAGGPAG
jgi:mono/diheme cytochrome c family protein